MSDTEKYRGPMGEKVYNFLLSLPEEPDLLASYLQVQGCKGDKYHSVNCPMAILLRRNFDVRSVGVGLRTATLWASNFLVDAYVELPPKITNFIFLFDIGHYPDLIDKEEKVHGN